MVRVAGLTYACEPGARIGARISDLRLGGRPLEARRKYRVAGWAPVAEGASGEPIRELVARYLRAGKTIPPPRQNLPRLIGVQRNPGIAA